MLRSNRASGIYPVGVPRYTVVDVYRIRCLCSPTSVVGHTHLKLTRTPRITPLHPFPTPSTKHILGPASPTNIRRVNIRRHRCGKRVWYVKACPFLLRRSIDRREPTPVYFVSSYSTCGRLLRSGLRRNWYGIAGHCWNVSQPKWRSARQSRVSPPSAFLST